MVKRIRESCLISLLLKTFYGVPQLVEHLCQIIREKRKKRCRVSTHTRWLVCVCDRMTEMSWVKLASAEKEAGGPDLNPLRPAQRNTGGK